MTLERPDFEHLRPLGRGATAQVSLVRLRSAFAGLEAGTEVALKRPVAEGPEALEPARTAFEAEAAAGRAARDPSLIAILHYGEDAIGPFLLTRYVPGRSLRETLSTQGPLPEPLLRRVAAQLAGALDALHGQGLVHGDVKPENIRLDEQGRAVLLDLGFAQGAAAPDKAQAGSLAYLSPERAAGAAPSPAADVFALGAVLYEMCAGVHPFGYSAGEKPARTAALIGLGSSSGELLRRSIEVPGADELLAAIATCRVIIPSHFAPALSPFLDAILLDILARYPGRRPVASAVRARFREGEAGPWWRSRTEGPKGKPQPRPSAHATPLIGRDAELASLLERLDDIRKDGKSQVVWLAGPEGSGKWRLVNEFADVARHQELPPLYLYARCNDRSEARPGGSLLLLLHRFLQLPPGAPPQDREAELLRTLVVPGAARTLLSALGTETVETLDHSPAAALAEGLCALGNEKPTIVFLDDLHRAGTETLAALNALVDSLSETKILLVLGTRDDREPQSPRRFAMLQEQLHRRGKQQDDLGYLQLRLGPLTEDDVEQLVERLFHRSVPKRRLARVLWLRSRGNPGLFTELLRELKSRGAVAAGPTGEDGWRLTVAPDELPLPTSLHRLITERYQALDPQDRRWLGRMSVAGGRIEPEFLMRAFPPTGRAEIDSVLARLVNKGWLVPAATRYRFERPALREAVYGLIGKERRSRLHQAAAGGLADDESDEGRYQHAFHLRAAEEHALLYAKSLELVDRLRTRASASRLLTVARWGLEALESLPNDEEHNRGRLRLLEVAADAADRLGQRDEERAFLDHMVDLDLDPDTHPREGSRMYLLHGRYAAGTGQFGLARGMLRNAVQLASDARDNELSSEALRRLSQVQAQIGELEEAEELGRRAVRLAADSDQEALARLALVIASLLEDRIEEALEHVQRAITAIRSKAFARRGVVANAQMLRARAWRSAGQPLRALGAAGRAVRLAQKSGERRLEAEARARFGRLLLDVDRVEEAERELRDALYVADRIEDRRGEVLAGLLLGILLWENSDAQAFDSIRESTAQAREIGFARAEAVGTTFEARMHRERGDIGAADEASRRSLELLEHHGAELLDRITIQGTRCLVLETRGKRAESRNLQRALRSEVRRRNKRIGSKELRRAQADYAERLLELVLSPEGTVYPRTPR